MRIFDRSKQTELNEIDRDMGKLVRDKLFIAHHSAREASDEVGHYEVIREYSNGGKDVKWVVDKPAVTACEEHDEYEDILVFVPYTERELEVKAAQKEIMQKKELLKSTDYKAIKFAEGMLTEEEYKADRLQRQAWRDRIGELEKIMLGEA